MCEWLGIKRKGGSIHSLSAVELSIASNRALASTSMALASIEVSAFEQWQDLFLTSSVCITSAFAFTQSVRELLSRNYERRIEASLKDLTTSCCVMIKFDTQRQGFVMLILS